MQTQEIICNGGLYAHHFYAHQGLHDVKKINAFVLVPQHDSITEPL